MSEQIRLSVNVGGFNDGTPDIDFSVNLPADAPRGRVAELANSMTSTAVLTYFTAADVASQAAPRTGVA